MFQVCSRSWFFQPFALQIFSGTIRAYIKKDPERLEKQERSSLYKKESSSSTRTRTRARDDQGLENFSCPHSRSRSLQSANMVIFPHRFTMSSVLWLFVFLSAFYPGINISFTSAAASRTSLHRSTAALLSSSARRRGATAAATRNFLALGQAAAAPQAGRAGGSSSSNAASDDCAGDVAKKSACQSSCGRPCGGGEEAGGGPRPSACPRLAHFPELYAAPGNIKPKRALDDLSSSSARHVVPGELGAAQNLMAKVEEEEDAETAAYRKGLLDHMASTVDADDMYAGCIAMMEE